MVSRSLIVGSPEGIRPVQANRIVQSSSKYCSTINIMYKHFVIDAKSILTILGAAIKGGEELVVECAGSDENEALDQVCSLLRA